MLALFVLESFIRASCLRAPVQALACMLTAIWCYETNAQPFASRAACTVGRFPVCLAGEPLAFSGCCHCSVCPLFTQVTHSSSRGATGCTAWEQEVLELQDCGWVRQAASTMPCESESHSGAGEGLWGGPRGRCSLGVNIQAWVEHKVERWGIAQRPGWGLTEKAS